MELHYSVCGQFNILYCSLNMYLIIVFSCTAAMDKSTSFLCWTAIFIILHGEIRSQPIYENYKEDCLITNRTDSYYKEIYGK